MEQIERIKVPVDDLEQLSADIKAASGALQSDTERIDSLLSEVTNSWKSDTEQVLVRTAKGQLEECGKLLQTLEKMTKQVDSICEVYRMQTHALLTQKWASVKE